MGTHQYDGRMLDILLLSRDSKLISALDLASVKLGMKLTTCSELDEATAVLAKRKVYGVLLDATLPETATLLTATRHSTSSKNAVSIAFISTSQTENFGAAFVVAKPVSAEVALRTLRAAQGQMIQEVRRYFRHPVLAGVTITTDTNQELQATAINISRHGLGVQCAQPRMLVGTPAVRVRFALPTEDSVPVELTGRVVWFDEDGKAGFECRGATGNDEKHLEEWLGTLPISYDAIQCRLR